MRKKLTQEERKARAEARGLEELAREKKFPPASLGSYKEGYAVSLSSTSPYFLTTKKYGNGSGEVYADSHVYIGTDILSLAEFIRALVLRYNALVKDCNEVVAGIPMLEINVDFPVVTFSNDENGGEFEPNSGGTLQT